MYTIYRSNTCCSVKVIAISIVLYLQPQAAKHWRRMMHIRHNFALAQSSAHSTTGQDITSLCMKYGVVKTRTRIYQARYTFVKMNLSWRPNDPPSLVGLTLFAFLFGLFEYLYTFKKVLTLRSVSEATVIRKSP